MKQFKSVGFTALCVVWGMIGSGCMSGRVLTDLKPVQQPELTAAAGKFYIAELEYASENAPAETRQKYQNRILPVLRTECVAAYPNLFADSPSGAIPLRIEVSQRIANSHMFKTMGWMYGTLLVCGVILPCPGQTDEEYEINVSVWSRNTGARLGTPELTKNFRNENHVWVSLLTPIALITIPGESDFPKMSGSLFNLSKMENRYFQDLSQQIAAGAAQLVTKEDPSYWTAAPVYTAEPFSLPSQNSGTLAPMALPTETVAPF